MALIPAGDIRFICYDFDGVMTDNRVYLREDGLESVTVNRGDGLAVAALKKLGVPQLILSTEKNRVVAARADKLKIPVLHGIDDKDTALAAYAKDNGLALANTVYIGNDTNDLAAMRLVGYPVAPADAHASVRALAVLVTAARGGEGVVREFYDTVFC